MKLPCKTLFQYSTHAVDDVSTAMCVTFGRDIAQDTGQLRFITHEGQIRYEATRGDLRLIRDTLNEILEDWQ